MMSKLLKELNRLSPFLYEVMTDGNEYAIYCESSVLEHGDYGLLENMTENECETWLDKLIKYETGEIQNI